MDTQLTHEVTIDTLIRLMTFLAWGYCNHWIGLIRGGPIPRSPHPRRHKSFSVARHDAEGVIVRPNRHWPIKHPLQRVAPVGANRPINGIARPGIVRDRQLVLERRRIAHRPRLSLKVLVRYGQPNILPVIHLPLDMYPTVIALSKHFDLHQ